MNLISVKSFGAKCNERHFKINAEVRYMGSGFYRNFSSESVRLLKKISICLLKPLKMRFDAKRNTFTSQKTCQNVKNP